MKQLLLLPILFLFFVGQAQTSEERLVLVKSIKKETNLLKKNLEQQKKINTKKIASFLSENPNKKKHFVKNGSTYFLQKINPLQGKKQCGVRLESNSVESLCFRDCSIILPTLPTIPPTTFVRHWAEKS
mgnify:CR=1 FL=1